MPVFPGAISVGSADTTRIGSEYLDAVTAGGRAALWSTMPAGGSLDLPHPGTSSRRIVNAVPLKIPAAEQLPGVWKCRFYLVCEDAAVTITPKVRKVNGTPADAVTGAACSGTDADAFSGTNQEQALTFTAAAGDIYVAYAEKSANTKDCWVTAVWERTDS